MNLTPRPVPTPPAPLNRAIAVLLAAGVAFIPVDGVRGPGALGELGSLLCFPPFALAVGLSIYAATFTGWRAVRGAMVGAAIFVGAIVASALINLTSIEAGVFHNRSGLMKLATSLLVIVYGFCLAAAFEQQPLTRVARLVAASAAVSALACLLFGLLEYAAKHGAPTGLYTAFNHVLHSTDSEVNAWDGSPNLKVLFGWDPRLRTLSFEPPAFGNFTGFAWPWLVYGALISRRWSRAGYIILSVFFTGLIVVSEARTGWLMLAANIGIGLLLATVYFNRSPHPAFAFARLAIPTIVVAACAAFALHFAIDYRAYIDKVVASDSISDLSRSASQIAAYRMFLDHPLSGFGLGQYAFHAMDYMPSWGFLSSEIWPNFTYDNAPWPAVYSVFARLAAETGLLGLLAWIGLWAWVFIRVITVQPRCADSPANLSRLAYPLAMNAAGVLVSGIATDTFKTPMIWVSGGLAFAFMREAQRRSRELRPARAALARSHAAPGALPPDAVSAISATGATGWPAP